MEPQLLEQVFSFMLKCKRSKALAAEANRLALNLTASLVSNQDRHPDLNDYGIAPDRDIIDGEVLILCNFTHTRRHHVSIVLFLGLSRQYPTKITRRDAGWRLPAFAPAHPLTVTPQRITLPFAQPPRRIINTQ